MSDTPLGPKGHRALMSHTSSHYDVAECDEVAVIAVFFCKKVGQIYFSGNMLNADVVGNDAFAYCIFSYLNVPKALCRHVWRLLDSEERVCNGRCVLEMGWLNIERACW